ncbi:hypothetical protein ACTWPF_16625 [Oceanobacillus sp. M65]|uniref:DRBM domain-containing protein n=1 Tax=Oceanobacillus jordanicus TaxID=2867266 RepID=A0AAW5B955_9BACI|nr:hypothetical protein [Oceanobacillus jordanicus]MCG3421164.1 hypothetical protein [Oceanobacillus jordanicus]
MSCMILRHPTISNLTKCKMLRFLFHEVNFEIHVVKQDTVVIYVWNIQQTELWQAAVMVAVTDIEVGYGKGFSKHEARKKADHVLRKWVHIPVSTGVEDGYSGSFGI